MELKGKVALVTGGGSGIGAGIAEALLEAGAKVVITDIESDRANNEARRLGGEVLALQHDVTDLASWAQVREAVLARFGQVDVLCNNAGIALPFMPLTEVKPETFARLFAVNVTGVYNGVLTFADDMKRRGEGHIVNTSSQNGLMAHATFAAYTATKFAVAGMSEALQGELAPYGVGVSILYPGLTRSRMSMGQTSAAGEHDETIARVMASRMMEPVWLGRAVVRAIQNNELHIVTHPGHRDSLEARFNGILAAHGEPAQPGYGQG